MARHAGAALAAALGLLLLIPVNIAVRWAASAAGVDNAEDAHGFEGLALVVTVGLCLVAWLLVASTCLVAYLRDGRADGPVLWVWSGLLALAAFAGAALILEGAWQLRADFAQDSVAHAALAVWTAAAGVVAALLLPWRGRPESGAPAPR